MGVEGAAGGMWKSDRECAGWPDGCFVKSSVSFRFVRFVPLVMGAEQEQWKSESHKRSRTRGRDAWACLYVCVREDCLGLRKCRSRERFVGDVEARQKAILWNGQGIGGAK